MPVLALNHASITVSDLDRSLAFWRDVIGLALLGRGEAASPELDEIIGVGTARLDWAELAIPGGAVLELFCYREPTGTATKASPNDPGSTHIALEVSDLDQLVGRLRAFGAPIRSAAPVTIAGGAWQGWRDLYVHDPDGVLLELSERPASAE